MTDYVIEKQIENVGGETSAPEVDAVAPTAMTLGPINVPLFEQSGKDPFDSIAMAPPEDKRQDLLNNLYAQARANEEAERGPTGGANTGDKVADVFDYVGSMAKDAVEVNKQVFVGGPLDAAQSFLNFGLDIGQWTYEAMGIPASSERFTFADNMVPKTDAQFLNFQRSMVEYMSSFAGATGLTKGVQAATMTKNIVNGMVADFITTDPREEKVQELLRKNPALVGPFTTAMQIDDISSDMWTRVETAYKGALMGMGIDVGSRLGMQALKSLVTVSKNYNLARYAKKVSDKALVQEVAKDMGGEATQMEAKLAKDLPPPVEGIQTAEANELIEVIKAGKHRTRAFNLTLQGITSKKETQRVIDALINANFDAYAAQKGGVKARAVLEEEAKKLNMTVADLLRRHPNTPTYDAMNRAAADVMEKTFDDLVEAAELYTKGKIGADDLAEAYKVADAIGMQVSNMATMSGRAEQAWAAVGATRQTAVKRAKQLQEMSHLYGENFDLQAKALAKAKRYEKKVAKRALEYAQANGRIIPTKDDLFLAINNWRLSNPATHTKNIVSNLSQTAGAVIDSGFQETIGALTGRKMSTTGGETVQLVRGMFEGFGDAMATIKHNAANPKEALPIFTDVQGYAKMDQVATAEQLTNVGKTASVLKFAIRGDIVGKALGWGDDIFKAINYRGELRRETHRIAKLRGLQGEQYAQFVNTTLASPPAEIHNVALDAAREHTFTRDRVGLGLKMEQLVRDPAWRGIDRLLLPFIGTNLNVLEQTLMRTPVLGLLTTRARSAVANRAVDPRAFDKLIGKQATGAAFLGTLAVGMEKMGFFQPQLVNDPEVQRLAKSAGIKENTLKIGDTYYSFDATSPMAGTIKFLANMSSLYSIASEDNNVQLDEIMQVAASAVGELFNPAFITDAGGAFINALNKGDLEEMRYAITGLGSSVVPYNGLLRALTKDGTSIDTTVAGGLDAWMAEMTNQARKIIAPEGMPRHRDMFGRPIPDVDVATYRAIDPFSFTQSKNDPVLKEIIRLTQADAMMFKESSDKRLVITKPRRTLIKQVGKTVAEQKYPLNANEYERLTLLCAGVSPEFVEKDIMPKYEKMLEVMSSDKYIDADDSKRKAYIHSIETAYKTAGEKVFFMTSGKAEEFKNTVTSILIERGLR